MSRAAWPARWSGARWAWLGALPLLGCSVLFGDDLEGLSAADPGGAGGAGGAFVEDDEVSGGVVRVVHAAQARPCSGVVLVGNWVLTAAGCVPDSDGPIRIESGSLTSPGGLVSTQVVERHRFTPAEGVFTQPDLILLRTASNLGGSELVALWWRDTDDLVGRPITCHGHREEPGAPPRSGSFRLSGFSWDETGLVPGPWGIFRLRRADMLYLRSKDSEAPPPLAPGGGCFTPDGALAAIVVDPTASTGPGGQVGVSLASAGVREWIERTLFSTPEPLPFAAFPLGPPGVSRGEDGRVDIVWVEGDKTLRWGHYSPRSTYVMRVAPPLDHDLSFSHHRPASYLKVDSNQVEFAVRADSGRIFRSSFNAIDGWSSWRDAGQSSDFAPAMTLWSYDRSVLLVTAPGGKVRFRLEDPASQEGEWQEIGDGVHGPPAAVSGSSGLHVFARRWLDGRILYKRYADSWWPSPTTWHELPLEMPCPSELAVVMKLGWSLELFTRGCTTSTLLHARQEGDWHGWLDTGIPMPTSPSVESSLFASPLILWSDPEARSIWQTYFPR